MSRKPSYFDEDYDEKVKNKKSFDIKAFFQVILLYIVMGIKWLRDTAVAIYQKLQGDEVEYTPVEPSEAVDDDIDIGISKAFTHLFHLPTLNRASCGKLPPCQSSVSPYRLSVRTKCR